MQFRETVVKKHNIVVTLKDLTIWTKLQPLVSSVSYTNDSIKL